MGAGWDTGEAATCDVEAGGDHDPVHAGVVVHLLHEVLPLFVHDGEVLCVLRPLPRDLRGAEDGLQVHPVPLHLEPLVEGVVHVADVLRAPTRGGGGRPADWPGAGPQCLRLPCATQGHCGHHHGSDKRMEILPPRGATTTGPDATPPPAIFHNFGGGGGGDWVFAKKKIGAVGAMAPAPLSLKTRGGGAAAPPPPPRGRCPWGDKSGRSAAERRNYRHARAPGSNGRLPVDFTDKWKRCNPLPPGPGSPDGADQTGGPRNTKQKKHGTGRRKRNPPPPPRVAFRRVVVSLRGPGQSPVLPFACCVRSLRSVGRCGRCSCRCCFRVRGAPSLVCRGCAASPPRDGMLS